MTQNNRAATAALFVFIFINDEEQKKLITLSRNFTFQTPV